MADPHVISALNAKYARLTGQLRKLDRQSEVLRRDISAVEATIRLFRKDWQGEGIAAVAPIKPSRWGGRGQGVRLALDVLRGAEHPLTAREVATGAFRMQGLALPDSKTITAVAGSIEQCLARRAGNGVNRIDGKPPRWSIDRSGYAWPDSGGCANDR
jgi:hypothetical protein